MSKRTPALLLEDILEAASRIIDYTGDINFEEFVSDTRTVDAVIRNFEIIGEASHSLPEEFKNLHPEINWQQIWGFRNRIVHGYFGIDNMIVWKLVTEQIPLLRNDMTELLKSC